MSSNDHFIEMRFSALGKRDWPKQTKEQNQAKIEKLANRTKGVQTLTKNRQITKCVSTPAASMFWHGKDWYEVRETVKKVNDTIVFDGYTEDLDELSKRCDKCWPLRRWIRESSLKRFGIMIRCILNSVKLTFERNPKLYEAELLDQKPFDIYDKGLDMPLYKRCEWAIRGGGYVPYDSNIKIPNPLLYGDKLSCLCECDNIHDYSLFFVFFLV